MFNVFKTLFCSLLLLYLACQTKNPLAEISNAILARRLLFPTVFRPNCLKSVYLAGAAGKCESRQVRVINCSVSRRIIHKSVRSLMPDCLNLNINHRGQSTFSLSWGETPFMIFHRLWICMQKEICSVNSLTDLAHLDKTFLLYRILHLGLSFFPQIFSTHILKTLQNTSYKLLCISLKHVKNLDGILN